jgi:hydroxymethylbilane synthase
MNTKPAKTNGKKIRVGSRGSALALAQDEEVIAPLRRHHPDLEFEVVTVRTSGDANQSAPLAGMGLGVFVKELEQKLLNGDLDMAVHSLKDMPTRLPEGLMLGAILPRKDARDVLVNRWNCPLDELPEGARIGTSSPRRTAQLMKNAPQVLVVPIRGNVETRLRKAQGEEADGVVLAAAGLIRLGLTDSVAEYLSPQRFVPPPGQGVLAVEIRADDQRMQKILKPIEDAATRYETTAERAFLELIGGGCQLPVGAYAKCMGEELLIRIFMSSEDGSKSFTAKIEGLKHDPLQLATDAYLAVVERGGHELVKAVRPQQEYTSF